MDGRPDMYQHQRADIRLRVRADALFRIESGAGHARVRNVSAGGVEVFKPKPRPAVGTPAAVLLVGDDVRLGPLAAEVVRETDYGVAFRFLGVDKKLRTEILTALQNF